MIDTGFSQRRSLRLTYTTPGPTAGRTPPIFQSARTSRPTTTIGFESYCSTEYLIDSTLHSA